VRAGMPGFPQPRRLMDTIYTRNSPA
jgi:hypothetical protein